jgi:hypothetical protein
VASYNPLASLSWREASTWREAKLRDYRPALIITF